MALALGFDVGGSSVKVALIDEASHDVLASDLRHLDVSRSVAGTIEVIGATAAEMVAEYGPVASIGVGLPGIFDESTGAPTLLPNFPAEWIGCPLRETLERELHHQVVFINDAKAFAIAEGRLGAGVGFRSVACVALGTGVGGGVVIDGELWTGAGAAGEFGHITVKLDGPQCGCGNRGCVEAFAGSQAICANGGQSTSQAVFEAAARGDRRAQSAVERAIGALGAGLANVFITLAPEVIVVGGGLAAAADQLIEPLAREIRQRVRVAPPETIRIVAGRLGRNAGAIGAALAGASSPLLRHNHGGS